MTMEMACGLAYEDLTEEDMMDVDGGTLQSLSPVVAATTLPCGVGATIGAGAVTIWWYTTHH